MASTKSLHGVQGKMPAVIAAKRPVETGDYPIMSHDGVSSP